MSEYTYVGNKDPYDATSSLILERDSRGDVTKSVVVTKNFEADDALVDRLGQRFVIEPAGQADEASAPSTPPQPQGQPSDQQSKQVVQNNDKTSAAPADAAASR